MYAWYGGKGNLTFRDEAKERRTCGGQGYPALSVPAGAGPVTALDQTIAGLDAYDFAVEGQNIDFEAVGGDIGPSGVLGTPSHSYLFIKRYSEVWKGYRVIQRLFER